MENVVARSTSIGVWAATLLIALATTTGCESEQAYAGCSLDKEVTSKGICSGGQGKSADKTTSCVVTKHPHCVDRICLSHFAKRSICSKPCTSNADCLLDGIVGSCWEFKPSERYCVPPDEHYQTLR